MGGSNSSESKIEDGKPNNELNDTIKINTIVIPDHITVNRERITDGSTVKKSFLGTITVQMMIDNWTTCQSTISGKDKSHDVMTFSGENIHLNHEIFDNISTLYITIELFNISIINNSSRNITVKCANDQQTILPPKSSGEYKKIKYILTDNLCKIYLGHMTNMGFRYPYLKTIDGLTLRRESKAVNGRLRFTIYDSKNNNDENGYVWVNTER